MGFGGTTVRGANSRSRIELGRPREIEQRDVNRALDRVWKVQLREDRMVLQLFPQDFVVDDQPGHRDPRSMLAPRLEANAHLITGSVQEHNCLVGAVNQAHLAVEETVFEPLAAHYAAILPEDRREGIALVDIGAQSTDLVVYYDESCSLPRAFRFAAITSRAMSRWHSTSAMRKRCWPRKNTAARPLELTADNSSGRSDVCRRPRVARSCRADCSTRSSKRAPSELFDYVRRELARVGMERSLMGGVVLSGGGARLPGMCDMAESVLNCQARQRSAGWDSRTGRQELDDPVVDHGGGPGDVLGEVESAGRAGAPVGGIAGADIKVRG